MKRSIGLVSIDVPEPEVLALQRFILHHCGIAVVPVAATALRRKETLARYTAMLFPGGGPELYHRDLGNAGTRNLLAYVAGGGGCVCICAGCSFAFEIGLLTGTLFSLPGIGVYRLQNRRQHPVFRSYAAGEAIPVLRLNGPLLEVTPPTRSLADYDPEGRYACVVARTLGKGRVIGFSAHPEGGLAWGGGAYNPYFYFDGKVQKTAPMLQAALQWVSRRS